MCCAGLYCAVLCWAVPEQCIRAVERWLVGWGWGAGLSLQGKYSSQRVCDLILYNPENPLQRH